MKLGTSVLFAAILASIAVAAEASEESPVVLGSFNISSDGFGKSGPVLIMGKSDDTGVQELTISAFGRTEELDKNSLRKLKGIHVNGIQISHDGGWGPEGSKLIIHLSTGYVVSQSIDNRYIVVGERGAIEVYRSFADLVGANHD